MFDAMERQLAEFMERRLDEVKPPNPRVPSLPLLTRDTGPGWCYFLGGPQAQERWSRVEQG
ncbi:MAG: hypothetical protein FJ095_10805 [Deltaproteobacteria bacterium]|nr:hypothetical protein [Deltaproteobacteria bacterium]